VYDDDPRTLFELQERLGKGSFGSVYKAVNVKTKEVVAIKIISLSEDDAVEDVRREISILRECENSHIVKYYGSYFEEENLWVR
jgi:serine/threonine-protein kinase 24/25/MST4